MLFFISTSPLMWTPLCQQYILLLENHAYLCASSSRVANSGSWIVTRTILSHLLGELMALWEVLTQIADLSSR